MKPAQHDLSILPIDSIEARKACLEAVFQTSHLAISIARMSDGCFADVNQAFEQFFGHSREETIGRTSIQLGHWPDPGEREELVSRLLAGEQVTALRRKFRKKSGETGYAQVSAHIVDVGFGPHLVAILTDVTEQAREEEQDYVREARYRAMLEGSIDGFWVVDRQGRILDVNESYCRRSGYTREELLGMTVYDVDAAYSARQIRSNFAEVESKAARIVEVWHRAKDGSVWPIEISSVYLPHDGGQFHSFLRDISERKRDEEALRKSTEQFHSVVEKSPASMALVAPDGSIEYINRKAVDTFGYLPQDIPTMDRWWVQAYPDAAYRAQVVSQWTGLVADARARKREIEKREYRVTCKSGDVKLMLIYGVWIGDRVLAMFEDITERKRAEEALLSAKQSAEQAKAAAEEAMRAKDHFLAVLSHELRNPLTPVLAAVQLMQRKPNLSEDMRQPMEIIRRNVQLQARLIDDLLDLTRIVRGKLDLERKPLDIATVIERAVEISKPDIDARKLHFGIEMDGGPYWVNADAARLQQVIWNLLSNAVKFTPEGGCVGIRCYRRDKHLIIEVVDSGVGIEPEALDRIFDAFEQGGAAVTRKFGGLGLGLAIARRLVEMHDGTISAHSEGRNKGSTLQVSLPLVSTEAHAEAAPQAPIATGPSRRILLVEDNGDSALMMKMLLETFGYQVTTAGGVAQALEAIASQNFDLLISDLGLPDQSGLELMKELRRRGNTIKGIALSGFGQEEDVRRSREAGFNAHLTKPADADTLVGVVSSVI